MSLLVIYFVFFCWVPWFSPLFCISTGIFYFKCDLLLLLNNALYQAWVRSKLTKQSHCMLALYAAHRCVKIDTRNIWWWGLRHSHSEDIATVPFQNTSWCWHHCLNLNMPGDRQCECQALCLVFFINWCFLLSLFFVCTQFWLFLYFVTELVLSHWSCFCVSLKESKDCKW